MGCPATSNSGWLSNQLSDTHEYGTEEIPLGHQETVDENEFLLKGRQPNSVSLTQGDTLLASCTEIVRE